MNIFLCSAKYLKLLLKAIFYLAMDIIWLISLLVPKDENLWIFGAWFGERYADNSKYLFEYVNKNYPEIKAIWLTSNKGTYNLIKNREYKVERTFSLRAIYYSLKAKVGIISTGIGDINMYSTGNMQIVQLWHGTPLKKIMFDDKITFKYPSKFRKILFLIFPFLKKNIYYQNALLIATSVEVQKKINSAFKVPLDRVKITGYPRNDSFFQDYNKNMKFIRELLDLKSQGKKLAIYMPTHRREGKIDINELLLSDIKFINRNLQKLNCILLIKLHYYHMSENSHLKQGSFSNIIFISEDLIEQDIYNILKVTDILITDYSSVYFDYLLLDRPIIFTPFDIEDYLKNDRAFYYDYNEVTPGPKAKNWDEVLMYIEESIKYPDKYKEERKKIRNMFHKYQDGESSRRVFDEIIKLIS